VDFVDLDLVCGQQGDYIIDIAAAGNETCQGILPIIKAPSPPGWCRNKLPLLDVIQTGVPEDIQALTQDHSLHIKHTCRQAQQSVDQRGHIWFRPSGSGVQQRIHPRVHFLERSDLHFCARA